jgi:hypothetical protein
MSPEKKDKFTKKIDKMLEFLEEFKECLEESEEYDGEEWEEEPRYRSNMRGMTSMKSRYSRRGSM